MLYIFVQINIVDSLLFVAFVILYIIQLDCTFSKFPLDHVEQLLYFETKKPNLSFWEQYKEMSKNRKEIQEKMVLHIWHSSDELRHDNTEFSSNKY